MKISEYTDNQFMQFVESKGDKSDITYIIKDFKIGDKVKTIELMGGTIYPTTDGNQGLYVNHHMAKYSKQGTVFKVVDVDETAFGGNGAIELSNHFYYLPSMVENIF